MALTKEQWREKLHKIIFEADTRAGKAFDIWLLVLIVASVFTVVIESVNTVEYRYHSVFIFLEWFFTIGFTIEYLLRLYVINKPLNYAKSFYGIIDLLSILPAYLSLVITGTHYLVVIRALRLMRIFRILKLGHFMQEGHTIVRAMAASRTKISVFLFFILVMVTIIGALMHVIEGGTNAGFSNIPRSIYWAIVTLTTVGYGDISPETPIGQFFSSIVMILGYAVLAVPTGIVSAELIKSPAAAKLNTQSCRTCSKEGHDSDAVFCKFCGANLEAGLEEIALESED